VVYDDLRRGGVSKAERRREKEREREREGDREGGIIIIQLLFNSSLIFTQFVITLKLNRTPKLN
jgi:hypothetical protein